jgi:hypothetical protein
MGVIDQESGTFVEAQVDLRKKGWTHIIVQSTIHRNRQQVKFYLNGVVASTKA